MKGSVEVYGITASGLELICSESNLIVDGGREHIADIFTYKIPIAGTYYDVSNFTIAAISLGPSKYDLDTRVTTSAFDVSSEQGNENKFPILIKPTDTGLQPIVSSINPNSQHLNFIEFYASSVGIKNTSNPSALAITYGSYPPASGISIPGGSFSVLAGSIVSGELNKVSVVDKNGFIYLNPCSVIPATSINDSASGLLVSSTSPHSDKTIKYILSLTINEWQFLYDFYGGIDVIGLWVFDKSNFDINTHPFTSLGQGHSLGSGGRYATSLYNLDDYKPPKFKLFSKKIFFPSGLTVNSSYSGLTIIWSIIF